MQEYLCDGAPVTHRDFVRRALDPGASAVVEACAGSGKTWLLVGRIVRLLLAGVPPRQILALTFTRRAAQEMRQRLLQDLALLARGGPAEAEDLLVARGLGAGEARAAVPAALDLYERVAAAADSVCIETFHGWFWRILRCAPLGSGVPHTAVLMQSTQRLVQDAWGDFTASLVEGDAAALADYEALVLLAGDHNAGRVLHQFVAKRAEWWSYAGGTGPDQALAAIERACEPMRAVLRQAGFSTQQHPALALRDGSPAGFLVALRHLVRCWQASKPIKTVTDAIGRAGDYLSRPDAPELDLARAGLILLTQKGTPIAALEPGAMDARAAGLDPAYAAWLAQAHGALRAVQDAQAEWDALCLNQAGLRCGVRLLQAYEARKRRANAIDFTDIECHADRLLRDADTAAYLQAYLDSRYRHLLIDEFQDTSTLQWRVLQCWLNAYDGDPDRPSVFAVGDPKQSIYRFRRAEPRVFEAARRHLAGTLGAAHLRTNVTRRNPAELVQTFDAVFAGRNPLYQPQSSHVTGQGHVALLPLALEAAAPAPADGVPATGPGGAPLLRDVLTRPRPDPREDPHDREGRQLAQCLAHWVARLRVPQDGATRAARWSDVIVLVRRRLHLPALERAFREAAIPTLSDRRGGLLDCPEIEDLVALLDFLCTRDDLSLAHALRTPMLGCADADLVRIAEAAGAGWWERLLALAEASPALQRARGLLQRWSAGVGVLPVHDLLDRIFDAADLRARYAACMPVERASQVQANLDAFLQLALTLDAGRFPTLTRFLDEVRWMRDRDGESVDEGLAVADDAVRLMTIHGAKGLEAPIVALADAAAGEGPDDRYEVLLNWPPQLAAPEHFSLIGRAQRGGASRRRWQQAESEQREQEDWNLLYVAMTRARQVLIVSGSEGRRSPQSWYERLCAVLAPAPSPAPEPAGGAVQAAARGGAREIREFRPAARPAGQRRPADDTDETRLGQAWHALLESATGTVREGARPGAAASVDESAAACAASEFGLAPEQAALAAQAAERVLRAPALARYFDPSAPAWNELELIDDDGCLLRVDRLVELDDAVWILDYKWSCPPALHAGYQRQLQRYAAALASLYAGRRLRTALILADATLVETDAG